MVCIQVDVWICEELQLVYLLIIPKYYLNNSKQNKRLIKFCLVGQDIIWDETCTNITE